MSVVIQVVALTGGVSDSDTYDFSGQYVKSYDPDAYGGRGFATYTADIDEALHFEDDAEAWEFWRQQSKVLPLRPDGKPNRPLTAFSVEMVEVA